MTDFDRLSCADPVTGAVLANTSLGGLSLHAVAAEVAGQFVGTDTGILTLHPDSGCRQG